MANEKVAHVGDIDRLSDLIEDIKRIRSVADFLMNDQVDDQALDPDSRQLMAAIVYDKAAEAELKVFELEKNLRECLEAATPDAVDDLEARFLARFRELSTEQRRSALQMMVTMRPIAA